MAGGLPVLDHLQIAVRPGGEEAARRFYRDLLSLEEVPVPREVSHLALAWFKCGNVMIHLAVDPDFHLSRKAHPAFRVPGLENLRARLEAAGATPTAAVKLPGIARFHAYDPSGNRLEFIEAV